MHKYHNYILTFVKKKKSFNTFSCLLEYKPLINIEKPGLTKLPCNIQS